MGQGEVLKIMESYGKDWVTTDQVNKKTQCSRGNTTRALKKLKQQGYLERKSEEEEPEKFQGNGGRGFGQWIWRLNE